MPELEQSQFDVTSLGARQVRSPLGLSSVAGDGLGDFVSDDARLLIDPTHRAGKTPGPLALELAGPREQLYFDPGRIKAAIVTCGGLCPGINNVIRACVFELMHNYGVPE